MSRLRIIIVLWACCALALPTIARAGSLQDVLASYDWSAKAAPNLSTNPPPKEVVAAFIERGAYLEPADPPEELCAFAFADLRHTGNLSLVASVDNSGRMLCGTVLIVDKDSSQFEVWAVGVTRGDAMNDVSHLIKDLAGDDNLELVADSDFTWFTGMAGHCVATWPVIYAWTGSGYANVSDRFPRFYKDKLKRLSDQIAALPPSANHPLRYPDPGWNADCLNAEAAKIQRFLGISADAALSQAAAAASSSDSGRRGFGQAILQDVGQKPPAPERFKNVPFAITTASPSK